MNKFTAIVISSGLITSSYAQTVFWGSSAFGTQVQSDGTSGLTDEGANPFTFQIGTFEGVNDVAAANPNELSAAWRVLDQSGFDETNVLFDSKAALDGSGYSDGFNATAGYDFRGEKLFIWVYDGNSPAVDGVTEQCNEWALFTGDWDVPTSADQTTLPLEFRTSTADATAPLYGGLNNEQSSSGEPFTEPVEPFVLQTHQVCLTAIPEPSSALLVLLSMGVLLGRRRQN